MRRAHYEVGWLEMGEGMEPMGFSLGFDFCAEHEAGAPAIKDALGIARKDIPVGIEDRTMTQVPEQLRFDEYEQASRDKRFKKKMPAALLSFSRYGWMDEPETVAERAKNLDVAFYCDFAADKRWYRPEKDDIAVAWSAHSGFAIHVRGEKNVRRLRDLHQALLACKVSLADMSINGFKRSPMSLVMNERVPAELWSTVRERDEAFLRLHQAKDATGIEQLLKDRKCGWYALSPAWYSGEGSPLMFFLNPADQKKNHHGWYTLEELQQWAEGKGPVVQGREAEQALKAIDVDFCYHLIVGLNEQGIGVRYKTEVWADAENKVPGLRILSDNEKLPSGVYSHEQLMPHVTLGQETRKRKEAEAAAEKSAKAAEVAA